MMDTNDKYKIDIKSNKTLIIFNKIDKNIIFNFFGKNKSLNMINFFFHLVRYIIYYFFYQISTR